MESVHCPACGHHESTLEWKKKDASYYRCAVCSLVYENPRLTADELKEFYSQQSYFVSDDGSGETSGYQNYCAQCTPALCTDYFHFVQRYSDKQSGTYCDVGCGLGGVLQVAIAAGWTATGVEISSWAVEQGRKNGLDIRQGSLFDAHFADDSFDAVSMFDVLEHLPDPANQLLEVKRILRPGGVLIMETPNVDGFFTRYLYKQEADLVKPRAHICLFGPRSMRHLLSGLGFSSFSIHTFPYTRRLTPGYVKEVVLSRILRGRQPVQLTYNDSLRVLCRK